jgi:hypothetical protein
MAFAVRSPSQCAFSDLQSLGENTSLQLARMSQVAPTPVHDRTVGIESRCHRYDGPPVDEVSNCRFRDTS